MCSVSEMDANRLTKIVLDLVNMLIEKIIIKINDDGPISTIAL